MRQSFNENNKSQNSYMNINQSINNTLNKNTKNTKLHNSHRHQYENSPIKNNISNINQKLKDTSINNNPKSKNKMFFEVENDIGDQAGNFGLEQNWKKSIEAPDWSKNLNTNLLNKKPNMQLKLDFVFGYRTRDTRNNLRCISENKIVYHSGCYGIVHDLKNNQQKIFSEHNDDIIAMAINNLKNLFATGENGSKSENGNIPIICIWDEDCNLIRKFEGNFSKGINSLNFSPDSNFLLAVSLNEDHEIYLFDLKENRMIGNCNGGPTKILDCVFKNEKEFVTVGIKHYKYWMIKNGNLYPKEGFFGQCDNKLGLVVCQNGNFITGSALGELTVWREEIILLNKKCHNKNVDSLYCKDE